MSADGIYRTRSLGVPTPGLRDQYADGRAAKVWELYMGGKSSRTETYREWFLQTFHKNGVKKIFDVACGTGIDSVMLLEAGYEMVSADASDKMLKTALEERWRRRKEPAFDKWIIKEANWLNLSEDLLEGEPCELTGYDAVICCGNSFAHLPDLEGNNSSHRTAIANFYDLLKPGGILVIDHRNYDAILAKGIVPPGPNVYYQGKFIKHITCSNLFVDGRPKLVTLDYEMDIGIVDDESLSKLKIDKNENVLWKFRLSYYPHKLDTFSTLLRSVFGMNAHHEIYADFQPLLQHQGLPAYYMHVIRKEA